MSIAITEWRARRAYEIISECENLDIRIILYPDENGFFTEGGNMADLSRFRKLLVDYGDYIIDLLKSRNAVHRGHLRLVSINGRSV